MIQCLQTRYHFGIGELRMSLRPLADAYRASYKQEHGSVAIQLSGATKGLLYVF